MFHQKKSFKPWEASLSYVRFGGKATKQSLYICEKIQWFYSSKAACIDVEILHEDFPNTMATVSTQADIAMQYSPLTGTQHEKLGPNPKPEEGGGSTAKSPKNTSFHAKKGNIIRLKDWLLEYFVKMAFKNDAVFPHHPHSP